ncbi:MAG: methyl-accepting chemotaxis protein [Gottschalkiaceae bacterium]|nr:MAG: methyl-accepting chemotaxis protein [Gottschalkiaceae bacterium]
MKKERRLFGSKSLKAKISLSLTLLILVMCAGLGIISYINAKEALIYNVKDNLPQLAESAASFVQSELTTYTSSLEVLGTIQRLKSKEVSWEEKKLILKDETERSGYLNLGISDLNGNINKVYGKSENISNKDYFAKAKSGESFVSDPFIDDDNRIKIAISVPFKDNGRIIGTIVAYIDASVLNNMVKDIRYEETGYGFIISKDGIIIGHPDHSLAMSEEFKYENMKKNDEYKTLAILFEKMMNGEVGEYSYTFAGENKLNGYAPIGDTGWSIAVTAPEEEVLVRLNTLRNSSMITSIIAIALGIVVSLFISLSITKPIIAVTKRAERIADLDISEDIDKSFLEREDEIGRIATAFQTILYNLREFISNVMNSAELVAASSEELTAISEQSAMASQSVATSSTEVAQNSEKQLREILDVTSSMEQISASVQEIYSNAEEINNLSKETFEQSNTGRDDIKEVISQMHSIAKSTEHVKESLEEVTNSSKKMNDMTNLIQNIAEQTNLLALNAAIEAARAGEQGRGFAVVAEEVRKLAEESQQATEDIYELIKNNDEIIKKANIAMEEGMNNVNKGMDTVNHTEKTFENIANLVRDVSEQIVFISESINQVAKGSESVVSSSVQLESMSKEVSGQIQNVSAATEEQTASMEEIASASQSLAKLAEELQQSIGRVKL